MSRRAIGIARAARAAGMPAVISFTVETDGRLRSGMRSPRRSRPATRRPAAIPPTTWSTAPIPTHFRDRARPSGAWLERIGGIRANASKMSHAELDEAPELDAGDPVELGAGLPRADARLLPQLHVLGGCCGTDHRHIGEISRACGHAHAA